MCEGEWQRQLEQSRAFSLDAPGADPRIEAPIVYHYFSREEVVEKEVIKRVLFEQFALPPLEASPR